MNKIEKKSIKIIIAGSKGTGSDYVNWLSKRFDVTIIEDKKGETSKDVSFILFTGGEDVDPSIYGEKVGKYTSINSERDALEESLFRKYRSIPCLGICRGAQLLTVLSGGSLIQHVDGHNQSHLIDIRNYGKVEATSSHHQMLFPYDLNKSSYSLIGYSTNFRSKTYLNGKNEEIELPKGFLEPEIVYYNNTSSLCIQGHPEWSNATEDFIGITLNLVEKHLITGRNKRIEDNWDPSIHYQYESDLPLDYNDENQEYYDDDEDEVSISMSKKEKSIVERHLESHKARNEYFKQNLEKSKSLLEQISIETNTKNINLSQEFTDYRRSHTFRQNATYVDFLNWKLNEVKNVNKMPEETVAELSDQLKDFLK